MATIKLEEQQVTGGGGGGVTEEYVDEQDALTLQAANDYTDSQLQDFVKSDENIIIEPINNRKKED